ncbi:uncharacterized protein [Temnothorax nylanderi]|uniref:uncharacterized protein n=1 Tax=Temnothorax nylanderi TaxID=102681 RepID=UPI003A87F5E4
MSEVFAGRENVKIARPVKTAELRICDLDDSVTPDELERTVAEAGKCPLEQVKVGQARRAPNGLRSIWVRCPVAAANLIARNNRLLVGWLSARVQLLEQRSLQCFRCLEGGHVRATWTSSMDRSTRCYRCGEAGHRAQDCTATPKCPVCTDKGLPAGHRAGSKA